MPPAPGSASRGVPSAQVLMMPRSDKVVAGVLQHAATSPRNRV
jgi:hypothetical protein